MIRIHGELLINCLDLYFTKSSLAQRLYNQVQIKPNDRKINITSGPSRFGQMKLLDKLQPKPNETGPPKQIVKWTLQPFSQRYP